MSRTDHDETIGLNDVEAQLLEACKLLHDELAHIARHMGIGDEVVPKMLAKAEAAITAAEIKERKAKH